MKLLSLAIATKAPIVHLIDCDTVSAKEASTQNNTYLCRGEEESFLKTQSNHQATHFITVTFSCIQPDILRFGGSRCWLISGSQLVVSPSMYMFTIQHSGTISNRVAPEQGTTAFCSLIDAMFYKVTGTYIHQAPL